MDTPNFTRTCPCRGCGKQTMHVHSELCDDCFSEVPQPVLRRTVLEFQGERLEFR